MELSSLIRRARRRPLWEPGRGTRTVQFDRRHIERILPHRDPFLLIDTITAVDLDQHAVRGSRRIGPDEPVFAGHFPNRPIYPGTFQIEMMGQLSACLWHFFRCRTDEIAPKVQPTDVRALRIHHALFQGEVLPRDELIILAKLLHADDYTVTCAGQLVMAGGNPAAAPAVRAVAVMEGYLADQ